MTNPYKSPAPTAKAQIESSANSCGGYVAWVSTLSLISWMLFIAGLSATFKDMFGGPAPPETWIYFVLGGCLSLAAQIVGLMVLFRSDELNAGPGILLIVLLMMLFSSLPLFAMGEVLYESIVRR